VPDQSHARVKKRVAQVNNAMAVAQGKNTGNLVIFALRPHNRRTEVEFAIQRKLSNSTCHQTFIAPAQQREAM
jgi:hypothetical protein